MPSDNTSKEGSTLSAASTTVPASSSTRRAAPPSTFEATPSQRNAMEEFIASPANPMGRRGHGHQNESADDDNGSRARAREVGNNGILSGQMNIAADESVDAPRAQPGLELVGEDNHNITGESVDALQPGLELVREDNCGLPVPIGIIEAELDAAEAGDGSIIKQTGHMEQITDRDGPSASSAVALAASLEATTDRTAKQHIKHQLETVNDNRRPVPFDSSQFEDSAGKMAKKLPATPSNTGDGGESIVYPRRSEIEDEVELGYINTSGGDEESPPVDSEAGLGNNGTMDTREDDPSQVMDATANIRRSYPGDEHQEVVLHAWPVEGSNEGEIERNEDVIIATPTLPWWKQRNTKLFLSAIFFVLVAMAIALGVAFSSMTDSDSDTTNATVLAQSSTPPSSSLAPSSPPTPCGDIIVSGRQAIYSGLGDPQYLIVAVDGSNMVIVVRDGLDSSTLHMMFYSLGNDVWVRTSRFEQDWYGGYADSSASVAISGKAAFVGLPYWGDNNEGMVLVYAQDEFGSWKEIEDPFTLDTELSTNGEFGRHADISDDLACVGDSDNTYLFHRDGDTKWIQFDMIANAYDCFVDGDTLVTRDIFGGRIIQLYTYISGGIVPLQDPIEYLDGTWVSSVQLNGNNLVIAKDVDGDFVGDRISIYHRDEVNSTFSFLQQLNISTPWNGYDSIDKDLMVAGADNAPIHVFSEQNGYWVETLVLDENHDSYTLSDRNLLVWNYYSATEIHHYSLDRCMQAWPTQTPSLSLMPSSPPTISPSSSPSISPTASKSPTGSYCITVTVVYVDYPTTTQWVLQSIGLYGNEGVLNYFEEDATSHTETVCLTEGDYQFAIYDIFGNGEGHYNVTTLDGQIIAEGGLFGRMRTEATQFSIPFVPALSISPTKSSSPTVSPSSSMAPSTSTSPTETCDWIEVTIVYDNYPSKTSWKLQSIGLDGTKVEVKSYSEADEDATSHTETACLIEGDYEFVIMERWGIGIGGEGHYTVITIDGQMIAEGGEFWRSEATQFSIPFVPAPSISPSPSMAPSVSTSPTASYCIIVTIVYADYPTRISWQLHDIGLDGTEIEVKSYSEANEDATSHTENVCLTEGEYEFVMQESYHVPCCYYGQVHYTVATIDGQMIAEGGEFHSEEVTRFSLPFVPAS